MKKRNRSGKTLLTLLLACLLIFMAGCGGEKLSDDGTQPSAAGQSGAPSGAEDTMKIGFVTAAGGVGDESLTDMVYGGIVDAVDEIGAEFNYVEPQTSADFLPMFKEFAQDGTYDVIIGVGYECAEPIAELAPAFPDQHFLAIDTTVEGDFDNVACIVFNRAEQGYIVGLPVAVLANADSITVNGEEIALDDSNNTIGSIIGTDAQTIVESQIGLYAACKYVDPSINILTGVVGTWTDSAKATEIALSMYSQGANIIWQNAGNGGKGIFSAAAAGGKFPPRQTLAGPGAEYPPPRRGLPGLNWPP